MRTARWALGGVIAGFVAGRFLRRPRERAAVPLETSQTATAAASQLLAVPQEDTFRSVSPESLSQRGPQRWKLFVHVVAAVLLLAVAAGIIYATARPPSKAPFQYPELAVMLRPTPSSALLLPEVRVSLEPKLGLLRCGPVHVDATMTVDDSYLDQLAPDQQVNFVLGLSGDAGPPANLRVVLDDRPFVVHHRADGQRTDVPYPDRLLKKDVTFSAHRYESFGATTPTAYYGFRGQVRHWRDHRADLRITFDADWSRRLDVDTCAISTPELVDTTGAATAADNAASLDAGDSVFGAHSGQVDVWAPGRLMHVESDTNMATSLADQRLFCSQTTNSAREPGVDSGCGRLLTVDITSRSILLTTLAIVAGALISMALQIVWELVRPGLRRTG